ncbi:MAG: VIT1/CCC1 transporter family protein [Parcubacteria group bacterium]|nr:VIT1/CCC1 transporter family protein [Parcubacteria group bacterium]
MEKHKRTFFARYLADFVYGANDGIVTTFAVVSGAAGASLSPEIVIILGIANLVADGFSMGASNYLAITSEERYERNYAIEKGLSLRKHPVKHSMATFAAFVTAGALPLVPFIFFSVPLTNQFTISAVTTAFAFFFVGSSRSFVNKEPFLKSGLEMLLIGGLASIIAYGIGWAVQQFIL